MKLMTLVLFLVLSFAIAFPAEASFCRNTKDHSICILSIKRSAKYYWEYRAVVSVDGIERPLEIYNCRSRLRVQKDGTAVPFEPNGTGELICNVLKR
ncbi:hypothetical protein IQ257_02470 [Coleofasciculus sp. LEGE 07092]|nr:hypothetical protein [Coleofasciculus sp. LEGE 07081]MBE9147399.1 hypothetical protein [Coleofasciculus sp. LEGE 07092]